MNAMQLSSTNPQAREETKLCIDSEESSDNSSGAIRRALAVVKVGQMEASFDSSIRWEIPSDSSEGTTSSASRRCDQPCPNGAIKRKFGVMYEYRRH
ncbi:hypothetical protein AMTR_s00085p00094400 [Amborella trichopoda]|uniref:Uncharacterized protein n=1 Tax=Amborella trichopoda TaxID=13333 RepID=W1P4X7_AMBTC|nr:hypothetical protein AMTR_s00085p00094400 [Amborella trichopoda]